MQGSLFGSDSGVIDALSPMQELGAYESLWLTKDTSFKTIAEMRSRGAGAPLSSFVDAETADRCADIALQLLNRDGILTWNVQIDNTIDFPAALREIDHPLSLIYVRGHWDLIYMPAVSVVGTRSPSRQGVEMARKIARGLVEDGHAVISGLAKGIDTAAHTAAIEAGGKTIAVLGTPINRSYPPGNEDLQEKIAREHLLISQVPIVRYEHTEDPTSNRFFFPQRNITMSALSKATVIVEAGETSGTLVQARHALKQGRKLFILEHNLRKGLKWPADYVQKGAEVVASYADIKSALAI